MLEEDITALYERMADMDQPPSHISIPDAGRAGRVRLTRRRATAVATPVLTAIAVIAIALVASIQGGLPGPHPAGSTQPAPRYFSPLRPYARFGWLPPGSAGIPGDNEVISQRMMSLGNPAGASLVLFAAGACHVAGHSLNCSPSGERYPLGRSVALVDGHPAYWTAPQPARGPLRGITPGVLAWQYAAGGWAVLDDAAAGQAPASIDAVKIAGNIRFGYRGEPAIRFPVQLTHVPANWRVNCVATSVVGHLVYAASFVVTAGRLTGSICGDNAPLDAPHFDAGQAVKNACGDFSHAAGAVTRPEVINGYQVVRITDKKFWPNHELCADDAAGTFVWIATGAHPALSPVSIFARHLRLLGSNPATWTTKPIG